MNAPLTSEQKVCIVCGKGPREVPDRDSGSNVKKVCRPCHGKRLQGDLRAILAHAQNQRKL
jgi:hypothetical protein